MKKSNLILLFIMFAVIGVLIFFLPDIYKKFQEMDTPKVDKVYDVKEKEEKKEPVTIDSDIISSLYFPIMHNDKYSKESYYQKKSITLNEFSNNDILYNAFLDLYDGYLIDHNSVGCAKNSKQFDGTYLRSRIKNIIGKNINYNLEDFTVPNINKDTNYIGLWKYNSSNDSYVFYGDCNNKKDNTIYYELTNLYKVDSSNDNRILYLYYNVGFVKTVGNNYYIYEDADYNNEVGNGILEKGNIDYDISGFKTYKYTYKLGLCSYDNYCFYKGEWVND